MIFLFFRAFALACRGHHELVLENLALRQQLSALKRTTKRPRLRTVDRVFWIRHGDYGSGLQSHESVAKPVRGTPDRFDSPRVSGSRDRHQRPHLRQVLRSYFTYYHRSRMHLGLDKDAPDGRPVCLPSGRIVATPEVGRSSSPIRAARGIVSAARSRHLRIVGGALRETAIGASPMSALQIDWP
jgi:hypothetical protein